MAIASPHVSLVNSGMWHALMLEIPVTSILTSPGMAALCSGSALPIVESSPSCLLRSSQAVLSYWLTPLAMPHPRAWYKQVIVL
jgi:hypothetical protein